MSNLPSALRGIQHPSRAVAAASLSTVVLPGLCLLGYATGLRTLAQIVPGGPTMVPGTAVALLLTGIGLWLVAAESAPVVRHRAGQAVGLLVTLYGGAVLVEYLTDQRLGIDALLFADRMRAWSTAAIPGRPSPQSAIALVVTGLALALLDADARRGYRPAQLLAPAGGLVAGVALLGHAYGLAYLSSTSTVNAMAYNTAATFVMLSVGVLACRPDRTAAQVFLGSGPGGAAVKRLARQLIELMDGRLDVESQPGQGSRFSFTIPVTPGQAPAAQKLFQDHIFGRRLLVVDDNPTSRHLVTQHTQAWGMTPTEAPDGHTALDYLHHAARHHHPYDVAVIDQHMPGIDGVELTDQINTDPALPPVNVILLTSGSHQDDQIAACVGVDAVLPKPVGPSQLYNCLLELLDPDTAQAAKQSGPIPVGTATSSRGLILLAEDNAINQMVAVDTLAMLGYQVDIARNGLEVLQLAGTKPYQAILMDCQMPKMDGYTATTELRHRENPNQHIPIIAMTAGALAEDEQRCLAAGMDDYLAKPIDPNQLQVALDRWTTETTQRQPAAPTPAGTGQATDHAPAP